MDDIGQFLFLLAFVIIAAIQWVIKQIQERNSPPEAEEEDPLEDTWRELEGHHESRRLQEEAEPPPGRREVEPQRPPAANPLSELRNLFESLKQPETPAKAPPQPRQIPKAPVVAAPPRPASQSVGRGMDRGSMVGGLLNAAELEALKRIERGDTRAPLRPTRRKANDGNFRKFLRGSGNLRQALILKEVFDRPLALKHESVQESLGD